MQDDLEIHGGEVSRRSEFFFWGFAVLALFLFLGHNALWASEERWAEVAREMLLSGDWLHPSLNWVIYFDKPQLSYWLILPFAVLLGGMDELVVRIPSALAGLAALYGVVSLGKTLFDKRTALLAGWMLLSCYGFLFRSRTAAADAANLAAITVAVAWFYRVEERAKFFHYLLFYLIWFLGALTKGLPALVMPVVVIAPHLLMENRWKKHLKFSNFAAFVLASLVYLGPLYIASVTPLVPPHRPPEANPLSGLELVWRENVVRVFRAFDHKDPIYIYLYELPRVLLPWVLLIGVGIVGLVRNWKQLPMRVRELMVGTLLMFLLFTLSSSRRWYYILPVAPFCALLGAYGLNSAYGLAEWNRRAVWLMRILVIVAGSLGVASLIALPLWGRFVPMEPPLLLVIALPVAGVLILSTMLRDNQPGNWTERWTGMPSRLSSTVLGGAIAMVTVFSCVMPSFTIYRTEKPFHLRLKTALVGIPPESIFFWQTQSDPKFLFYLDMPRPTRDTSVRLSRDATGPKLSREEAERRSYEKALELFRSFLDENRGRQVAIFSQDRERNLRSLGRAAGELRLPLVVAQPSFDERKENAIPSRSKKWRVWLLQVPQENPEQSGKELEK